jgi:tripartite-type tricarboxylate transporter receptor subunit TctC
MPGAGGMTALGYLARIAPQDGTVLSLPHTLIVQDGLLNPGAQFDPGTFQWIGRLTTSLQAGVASGKSNVRSLADAKVREVVAGGTAPNNPTALNPRILNTLAGTRFKIVTGYKGMGAAMIAWERGEIDVVTVSWDLITARYGDKVKAGLAVPLYVDAPKRSPELANVPLMTEFGQTEADKAFLQIYAIGPSIGRSLAAPPGVPKDRVNLWRVALRQMLADPGFKAAARKRNIRLDPLDGAALAARVAAVVGLPKERIAKARAFYGRLLAEVN